MAAIILEGKKFSYTVERKSIRSLRLRLKSPCLFVISCPRLTPNFVVNRFICSHSAWIVKNSRNIPPKRHLKSLKSLSILGHRYQLITSLSSKGAVFIQADSKKIYLYSKLLTQKSLSDLLEKHLRLFALSLIKQYLADLSSQYGFKYNRVSVKNQRTRYGSCSAKGNLNFNWQILFFPQNIFRHVLLHELTHLEVKNHSPKFWSTLTTYDPHARSHNTWLRQEGIKHFLFS